MSGSGRRLIEDYLPIAELSAEASREKSLRKGHISTLHLWWARRPLVACRAAVYGALVPASCFVPNGASDAHKRSLGRANAAKFLAALCKYPARESNLEQARRHILDAHAQRLAAESGREITREGIEAGRAPRPKVLDMFAGGGAIPLEALRLGCDAYALDLNPVAHIIELCTLVYPQKFGKPDKDAKGSAPDGTWAGLADEVRHWGEWVVNKVREEIGHLYPPIPDPAFKGQRGAGGGGLFGSEGQLPPGYLQPLAYLWTRTVQCKNPQCGADVPLVRQTWLRKKKGRYAALKMTAPKGSKRVRFELAEAESEKALGFDPAAFSKGGNAACPFCGTVADNAHVKREGMAQRMAQQLMAIVCGAPRGKGKAYLPGSALPSPLRHSPAPEVGDRPDLPGEPGEPIVNDAKNGLFCVLYGLTRWRDVFTPRQLLTMRTFAAAARAAHGEMAAAGYEPDRGQAVAACLALIVGRIADRGNAACRWNGQGEKIESPLALHGLPMLWDFAEANPFGGASGDAGEAVGWVVRVLGREANSGPPATVARGSATRLPWPDATFDAVVTDPPYYDNVPYADISDFFYVWLKRTIGDLFPGHFGAELTPKKEEAVADATRHRGQKAAASQFYEAKMAESLAAAHRVLKPGAPMVLVYAHKTTLGWATLVNALRGAGFEIREAWPIATERRSRQRSIGSAALASSIFLVARKRDAEARIGRYEDEVRPELERLVAERVAELWEMGVTGADLVIACVGAGLRAFSRFAKVEYANGEEVPAERFLAEVEAVVLDAILWRLSKATPAAGDRSGLAAVDPPTRFYILWRYAYRAAELDAGEAIIFANGTHVELDGPRGLAAGADALVKKAKSKYRLRDYSDRGGNPSLGLPGDGGEAAPLADVLHRLLWLMENRPAEIPDFLADAPADLEQLRLVAQALAGPALKGGELADVSPSGELGALAKLTANWKSVVSAAAEKPPIAARAARSGDR